MAEMDAEVFNAFVSVGVPEDKAIAAAVALHRARRSAKPGHDGLLRISKCAIRVIRERINLERIREDLKASKNETARIKGHSASVVAPRPTAAKRGRTPLSDSQITDGEFRRLNAKRLSEVTRTKVAFCMNLGTTLFAIALFSVGALYLLDTTREWFSVELVTIALLFCGSIVSIAMASKIAGTIVSED